MTELRYEMYNSGFFIYLIVHRGNDSEMIIVNVGRRFVVGRCFMSWNVENFKLKMVEHM